MIYKFTVPVKKGLDGKWVKIPCLNDYIKAERVTFRSKNGKFTTKGAQMKKEWQHYIAIYIGRNLSKLQISKPIIVHYHYYEPDARRDFGNIHATVQKFTEDALQDCGTIINDNQKYIRGFTADFHIDKVNPRIEVELEELE